MGVLLKQSTARNRMILMIDAADHVTGKTGLTPTVTLSKDGGAFAAVGGTVTEIANGWYKVALNTTDTNTLGDLVIHATGAGADPTDIVDQVVTQLPQAIPVTKNAALNNFLFQMTDSTAHLPKTGLVDANFSKYETLDGAAGAALSGTITEVDATNLPGIYKINLSAAETNGTTIALRFGASGCDTTELTLVTSA